MGRKKRGRRGRRRLARALIATLALVVGAALVGLGWLVIVYPKARAGGRGREVRIQLAPGQSLDALAAELASAGAVERPRVFAVYARLLGADEHLRDGEILLTDDMTPRDVLQRIAIGFGAAEVRVTIPEGFHRFAIAERLERWGVTDADAFIAATEDRRLLDELGIEGPTAEGYLFPDTYRMPQDLEGEEVVRRLVGNWQRRTAPIFEAQQARMAWLGRELAWGPHEALILASIVEKEAAVSEERPIIARVFINRLRSPDFHPKRLQADPTVSYGCLAAPSAAPSCARWEGGAITRSMLQDRANLYNTYRHEGLPPGPITNPGLASIRAVLDHEDHEYLYFVARGHGRHAFSATLEEHNAAVARYRESRR